MRSTHLEIGWLGLVASLFWASGGMAQAQTSRLTPERAAPMFSAPVPVAELPDPVREAVRNVVTAPTLSAIAPAEDFCGPPAMYQWLLDHPDRAAVAWRRLGSPCLEITDRGAGCFGWEDKQGSDLRWETVHRSPTMRIWYAEGKAKPSLLLPTLPVRAVVVLHHGTYQDSTGRPRICHQADLYLQTDSRTATIIAKLLGPTTPRLTEQAVSQLQIFFSALTRYVDRYPERAETLFFGDRPLGSATPATSDSAIVRR